jgi:hypothetical protein
MRTIHVLSSPRRSGRWNVALCCLALALGGCAETSFFKWKKERLNLHATPENPAVEVLCIWEAAEGRGPNGVPTRGFAGQILFFTHNSTTPVLAEGDVRIYLFDDQGTPEEQARPIHQFDFDAEAWKQHARMGVLGPSYNVFIPYTRKGSHGADCALGVRFRQQDAPVIYSGMTHVTLPGATKKKQDAPSSPGAESYDVADAEPGVKPAGASTAPQTGKTAISSSLPDRVTQAGGTRGESLESLVRQLSGTREAKPADPTDARLERLERMLEELLRERTRERDDRRFEPTPADLEEEPGASPRRFRRSASEYGAERSDVHRTTGLSTHDAWHLDDRDHIEQYGAERRLAEPYDHREYRDEFEREERPRNQRHRQERRDAWHRGDSVDYDSDAPRASWLYGERRDDGRDRAGQAGGDRHPSLRRLSGRSVPRHPLDDTSPQFADDRWDEDDRAHDLPPARPVHPLRADGGW